MIVAFIISRILKCRKKTHEYKSLKHVSIKHQNYYNVIFHVCNVASHKILNKMEYFCDTTLWRAYCHDMPQQFRSITKTKACPHHRERLMADGQNMKISINLQQLHLHLEILHHLENFGLFYHGHVIT